ncbi:transporter substrate-binding domain-containing protein [Eubacteriales bacterium OttesenSCG-928-G02]|nr:transporter substrate-binding domain-containing protein [Eubacteriales bacterium OttesenSCG-928-G02]
MKRIFYVALAAVMIFASLSVFAGCSNNEKDTLVCGVTLYAPMNYKDDKDAWTGFDTEFAQLVGEKLGMKVEFREINWNNKYLDLESGSINCIWNGFTANVADSDNVMRKDKVDLSYGYMLNQQCIIVKASNKDNYKSGDDLTGKKGTAEGGSAGEAYAEKAVGDDGKYIKAGKQTDTFIEVKSGAVDFAVVDILLALETVGKGNFDDLAIADIELESEIYAIGFKKGSDLKDKINKAMDELFAEGKVEEIAKKYGLESKLKLDKEFKG